MQLTCRACWWGHKHCVQAVVVHRDRSQRPILLADQRRLTTLVLTSRSSPSPCSREPSHHSHASASHTIALTPLFTPKPYFFLPNGWLEKIYFNTSSMWKWCPFGLVQHAVGVIRHTLHLSLSVSGVSTTIFSVCLSVSQPHQHRHRRQRLGCRRRHHTARYLPEITIFIPNFLYPHFHVSLFHVSHSHVSHFQHPQLDQFSQFCRAYSRESRDQHTDRPCCDKTFVAIAHI